MKEKTYKEMDDQERKFFQSELLHAILTWYPSFKMAQDAIKEAKNAGKFGNVKIGVAEILTTV